MYDCTLPRVAGAVFLHQPPSPFTNTIRPPTFPTLEPITFSIPVEEAPIQLDPEGSRTTMCQQVFSLLQAAYGLDLTHDQPYMPFPHTTMSEALRQLRWKGRLLIQGGCLRFGQASGGLYLKVQGQSELLAISPLDCLRLLKANYPLPAGSKRRHPSQGTYQNSDTVPCPPPFSRPVPQQGFAYFSLVQYGGDIDDIQEEEWYVCSLNRVYDNLMFMGDSVIDGGCCYVWWSLTHCCYVGQAIPRDVLDQK